MIKMHGCCTLAIIFYNMHFLKKLVQLRIYSVRACAVYKLGACLVRQVTSYLLSEY